MAETRKVFPHIRSVFPDLTGEILAIVAEGDLVATRARLRGTHSADFMGAAASHKRVEFDRFSFDRVVDGLIVQHNATADFVDLLRSIRADNR
jgi:predicted ester cyclase